MFNIFHCRGLYIESYFLKTSNLFYGKSLIFYINILRQTNKHNKTIMSTRQNLLNMSKNKVKDEIKQILQK